ncbi:MAG: long-chain-fatty-acid--CoA ligase [Bryobacterales bacterium]
MKVPLTPIRCLLWAADQYGAKVGVVDGEQRHTYRQVLDRSLRLAAALQALGVGRGDRVATLSFNCHQLLEAYYGVPMARAILLSLNVRLTPEEQAYILRHSGTRVVLFDPEFLPVATALHAELPELQWVALAAPQNPPEWLHPQSYEQLLESAEPQPVDYTTYDEDEMAELFYTSGSTGTPKGVMLSHRTLYMHALGTLLGTLRIVRPIPADQIVEGHTIPLFHANGWGRAHTVTQAGGRHVMVKRFDPQGVCELIEREGITTISMVPTMANALINFQGLGQYDLSSLMEVNLGGAASSPALVKAVEEKLGCPTFVGYGLTETSPVATSAQVKDALQGCDRQERLRRQSMTGYPMPGVELRVADSDGRDVPKDMTAIGEILIRGDVVMDGYWNEPEATAAVIENNWLHTGDMAIWDELNYVLIVDRKKDIIISGGENISSIEIEKVIAAHPAVYEVAVFGVPDDKWGEAPRAAVVLKPGAAVSAEQICDHVRAHLAGFKAPKSVDFLDELPKGSTGKILKRALREPYWAAMEKKVQG